MAPVCVFQRCAILSSLIDAMSCPSGDQQRSSIAPVCPSKRHNALPAGGSLTLLPDVGGMGVCGPVWRGNEPDMPLAEEEGCAEPRERPRGVKELPAVNGLDGAL